MVKRTLKILFILLGLMIFGQTASAQEWQLIMEMVVTNDGKKMEGATVEVRKNGSLVKSYTTDSKGAIDVPVGPNGIYELSISGPGLIKKKLEVNTTNVPPDMIKGNAYFSPTVDIFPKVEGLDFKILDEPIGKVKYDPEFGGFEADLDYTKRQKAALDKLQSDYEKQKANEAKMQAQKQKDYDAAIKLADKAYNSEQWEVAEAEYKKAAAILPIETYPSFQLAELETKLIKIRETNAKYDEAIQLADAAAASKDYPKAISEYKRATGYKPDEAYPQTKAKELQTLMAEQVKKDQIYLAAIEKGDNALKINDLATAKTAFEEASTAKPEETYPKNKLAEINDILGKKEAKEAEYQAAVKAADEALAAKDYGTAKSSYQKALAVKPTESYPQEQITRVDQLIADAAKRDQNYLAAVEKGDNSLKQNDLQTALAAFGEASKIKPEETYPANKIKEINDIIAKNQAADKAYQDKIKEADKLLAAKTYPEAKVAFEAASALKPTEAYPKDKMAEIDGILAAQAETEKKYQEAIAAGDKAYAAKDFSTAKEAYTTASQVKAEEKYPKDQLAAIGTILVKMEANQAKYDEAVKNGDEALAANDLGAAQKFYEEAKGIKTDETYPQTKLDEIAGILKKREEQDKAYNDAIAKADAALKNNELESAKAEYTKAKALKAEESYPQEQITKIDGLLADAAKIEEEYKTAIAAGDKALGAKDYQAAITSYKEAASKKPNEAYPKDKIAEAESLLKELGEKEAQYAEAIKAGDKAFQGESYEEAKKAYQTALTFKEDQYPKDQISAADEKLAALAAAAAAKEKLEADYQAAITEGQAKIDAAEFAVALTAFQKAAGLKPDEKLPKDKIAEIDQKQKELAEKKAEEERLAALQKEYDAKIAVADKAYQAKNYQDARASYQEALALKADEAYPKGKVEEINGILADAAEQDEMYQKTISEADQLLAKEDLEGAKAKYKEASSIKSEESYPKDKIGEIDGKLAALAAAAAEIALKNEKEAAKRKEYEKLLAEGDGLANQSEFQQAIGKYEAALAVLDEQLPKDKIEEMKKKIVEKESQMAEAAKAERDAKYQAAISAADALFKSDDFTGAAAKYTEALGIKEDQYPKDQLAAIEAKKDAKAKEAELAKIEASYQAAISAADALFKSDDFTGATAKYNEALGIKDDQYPKDQLAAIEAKKGEKAKEEELAKKEAQYQAAILEADALFKSEAYSSAGKKYTEALGIKEDKYPRDQLAIISKKMGAEEKAKKEAEYQKLVAEADALFETEKWNEAEAKYQAALAIDDKKYPKDQLEKIAERKAALNEKQAQLAAAAELETNYKNVIASADKAFQDKQYQLAIEKYQEAIAIKEGDPYPSQKIEEINGLLAAANSKNQKEAQYQQAVTAGDAAMSSGQYAQAKSSYEQALGIKPNENYPKDQIAKADQMLAEAAARAEEIRLKQAQESENEAAYQTAISEGDKLYSSKKYEEAINKYELALGLKPSKSYPAEQIKKIRAAQENDVAEAARRAKEAEDREKRYIEIITSANKSFDAKDYPMAKREYEAALSMKPREAFPKARINEINSILRGNEIAEKKEEVNDEPIEIQKGPKSTVDGSSEAEIDRIYQEMWAKKQVDKNSMIEEKREIVRKLREEDKKKEDSKRLNAIQKIENISISMVDQRKNSDEMHMQNFETVKSHTKSVVEKEMQLTKDSERKRNETMVSKDRSLENIIEERKEKNEEVVTGKKEEVEEDYEEQQEFRKELMGVQQKNIEELDDEFIQKEEVVRTFNKERADVNLSKNSVDLKKKEEDWNESVDGFQEGSYERTDQEKEKIYQKDIDLREYAKERNTEYLEGYEKVKVKTKDHEEFIEGKNETSLDRRMNEQERINDVSTNANQERMEGNQIPVDNYIQVVEKTEALQEEKLSLDEEAEKKRQENLKKEFYKGEDKPRQDPESANHPQGVSEEIIENDNGSTTIRRTKVEGTETDVYEKTLHSWGGIFYTKNGSNITKETWDSESK